MLGKLGIDVDIGDKIRDIKKLVINLYNHYSAYCNRQHLTYHTSPFMDQASGGSKICKGD